MGKKLKPDDLLSNNDFELLARVDYSKLKKFIFEEIRNKSVLLTIFGILQLISLSLFVFFFFYFMLNFVLYKENLLEFSGLTASILFSVTILIPIHELLHALAFTLLGKRDIGFGVQWKKFLFYTESNREVLNGKEITFVALLPFITILSTGIILYFIIISSLFKTLILGIVLLHFLFCGGDFAIISYFIRNGFSKVYTFDDRDQQKSYYFRMKRIESPS
jgi:hypothetical protein